MAHLSLLDNVLASQDIADQTASANTNGTALDMQGWDGVCFLFNIGAMASGATFDARIVSSANSNMSGATNIANAAITQVANTGNTTLVAIDIWRPSDRYLRSATQPATANVTFGSVAVRYRRSSGILPPTQSASQVVRVAVN
jgi:hypothetical protein